MSWLIQQLAYLGGLDTETREKYQIEVEREVEIHTRDMEFLRVAKINTQKNLELMRSLAQQHQHSTQMKSREPESDALVKEESTSSLCSTKSVSFADQRQN
mmetsp:Transcript_3967/g.4051  ORF Transcript_3967/g.4051 Transcript_3967/m.4051 type:complete len:101 (+) Transcript_3967:185-487(+)